MYQLKKELGAGGIEGSLLLYTAFEVITLKSSTSECLIIESVLQLQVSDNCKCRTTAKVGQL